MSVDLRRRITTGVAWSLVAAASTQGCTFLISILLARLLPAADFGAYVMLQSTLLTVSTLSCFAIGSFTAKYVAEFRAADPARAGDVIGACSVISVLVTGTVTACLATAAPWMASNVLRSANLAPHLTAGAIFVFFLTVNGYQTGALSGLEAYGRLGRAGATSAIVSAPATAFFAWKYGLMGAVSGMAFGAALRWLVHHEHLRRATHEAGVVIRHGKLRNVTPLLKRFAVPAALSGYVTAPAIWAASAMVFRQPGGAEAMAFYGAAATFRTAVLFLPNILNNVGLSILNHTKGGGDTGAYFGVFRRNVALMVLAAAAPSAALAFLGGGALRAFGPRYEEEAYRLLMVLLLAAVLEATSTGMYQLVQSHEQMWTSLFLIVTPRDGVLLLAAAILVPRHGVMGLAASAAVAQALGLAMTFLVGRHIRTRVLTPAGIVPRYSFSTRGSE